MPGLGAFGEGYGSYPPLKYPSVNGFHLRRAPVERAETWGSTQLPSIFSVSPQGHGSKFIKASNPEYNYCKEPCPHPQHGPTVPHKSEEVMEPSSRPNPSLATQRLQCSSFSGHIYIYIYSYILKNMCIYTCIYIYIHICISQRRINRS